MTSSSSPKPFVKGYKFPIYPTDAQRGLLERTFGCCRYVWNRALSDAKTEYESYLSVKDKSPIGSIHKPSLSGFEFSKRLPQYKADPHSNWLNEVAAVPLQQTMLHLGSAFSTFFKSRKGYPQFKKKLNRQSFTLTKACFRFKEGALYIAKSDEPLAVGYSRDLPSEPSSCTISRTPTGKYYISFICEYFPEVGSGKGKIGIDLGLKDLIVTSDGIKIPNPKRTKANAQNLRRKQQKLSRCKKGSVRRSKARLLVAKVHERTTNARNSYHHQISRMLVNENQVIGTESLMVANMIRNRRLSGSISDAAWGGLMSKIIYKARESQHCTIVRLDAWYPSTHLCSVTGKRLDTKLSLNDRSWDCPHCGQTHDRDINAAINIRNEALYHAEVCQEDIAGKLLIAEHRYQ